MTFALAIAFLSSIFTASCILIAQGIQAQLRDSRLRKQKAAGILIDDIGRMVTPSELAQAMSMHEVAAHKLLCAMVDDYYFTLQYDSQDGVYRFGFTERHAALQAERMMSDSDAAYAR